MTVCNPWLLDEALERDGLTFDTWHVPRVDSPRTEGESPCLHFVHTACQTGSPWLVTWCSAAVEWSGGHGTEPPSDREFCAACVAAALSPAGCPVCHTRADEL